MNRVRHPEADGVIRARFVSPQRNIDGVPARAVSYHDLLRPAKLKVRHTVLTFPPLSAGSFSRVLVEQQTCSRLHQRASAALPVVLLMKSAPLSLLFPQVSPRGVTGHL